MGDALAGGLLSVQPVDAAVLYPGDAGCGADYKNCALTHCCQSYKRFSCYEKFSGVADVDDYAQCMPTGTCRDRWPIGEGTCKVLELFPPPPPPSPPPVPVYTLLPGSGGCGENFGSCHSTHCCQSPNLFSCYEKSPGFAMCLHTGKCREQWPSSSSATCVELTPTSPSPPPPPPEFLLHPGGNGCGVDHGQCTDTHCCVSKKLFSCYEKRPGGYAECMPTGTCRDRWSSDAATCEVLRTQWDAPAPPPPSPPLVIFDGSPMCGRDFGRCDTSRCCQSPKLFNCYEKGVGGYAECMKIGTCRDRWPSDASATCTVLHLPQPPPPPLPPPVPVFTLHPGDSRCARNHGRCLDNHCCVSAKTHKCYAKSANYAECLPNNSCESTWPTGLCTELGMTSPSPPPRPPSPPHTIYPGSTQCALNFGNCLNPSCCQSHKTHACYEKREGRYAECMPIGSCRTRWPTAEEGSCKLLTLPAPPPPASKPPPPIFSLHPGNSQCSSNYENCLSTHCCQSKYGFKCYAKTADYAQCLPIDSCQSRWPDGTCEELVPTASPPPPLIVRFHPGDSRCGRNHGSCSATLCCQSPKMFSCYEKRVGGYAECMPIGTCRDRWPSEQYGTCKDLQNEASSPPPALVPSPSLTPAILTPGSSGCAKNNGNCLSSHCCQSSKSFACYEKGPNYAECMKIGTCRDRWPTSTAGTCRILELPAPPPPPSPPNPPVYTLKPGDARCSANFNNCLSTHCCVSKNNFACYQKTLGYAECLPIDGCAERWGGDAMCTELGMTASPSPPPPSPVEILHDGSYMCGTNHGSCGESHCCQSHKIFSCYEKNSNGFAMCLPTGTCEAYWPTGATCKKLHLPAPPPPPERVLSPPPSPPVYLLHPGDYRCGANFASCLDTHCCQSKQTHTCYSKTIGYAACLPNGQCNELWPAGSCDVLEVTASPPPPNPPVPDLRIGDPRCGSNHGSCSDTHCCVSAKSYACYEKNPGGYAECMKVGSCRERWPDQSTGTCKELHLPSPPSPPPPPAPPVYSLSPGDPGCASNFGSCIDTHCCQSKYSFKCYETKTSMAMCLPAGECKGRIPWGSCVELTVTLSPPPPPPPSPTPPFFVSLLPGDKLCSANWGNCMETHCCRSANAYTCYQKTSTYAACLPNNECQEHWPSGECKVLASYVAADLYKDPSMSIGDSRCSDNYNDCSSTHCCRSSNTFACYEKIHNGYASCQKTDTCVLGTCKLLELEPSSPSTEDESGSNPFLVVLFVLIGGVVCFCAATSWRRRGHLTARIGHTRFKDGEEMEMPAKEMDPEDAEQRFSGRDDDGDEDGEDSVGGKKKKDKYGKGGLEEKGSLTVSAI